MIPAILRTLRVTLIAASLYASGACKRPAHDPPIVQESVAQYPRAADRFMLLVHKQLSDSDPVRVEQEMMCEGERMSRALGPGEAAARIRGALDTAYLHHDDSLALPRVARALAGHALSTGNHVCDSLIAAADRTDPIVPVRQPELP